MEITLTEALRLKNELSNAIKTLQYSVHQSSFGTTSEDGQVISEDKFTDVEANLRKGLELSELLNSTIAAFNKESGVDSIVRRLQNEKLLLGIYTQNLQKTKPSKSKRFETVGNARQSIEITYTPLISSSEMKNKMSTCKSSIRAFQTQVEKLNQTKINVDFTYNDIENLIG
jgi:hypothetical protein